MIPGTLIANSITIQRCQINSGRDIRDLMPKTSVESTTLLERRRKKKGKKKQSEVGDKSIEEHPIVSERRDC